MRSGRETVTIMTGNGSEVALQKIRHQWPETYVPTRGVDRPRSEPFRPARHFFC